MSDIKYNTYFVFMFALKKGLEFLSVTYGQPDTKDSKDYRIISDHGLNIQLGKNVNLLVKMSLRYDSLPPDQIKDLDMMSSLGIGLSFN